MRTRRSDLDRVQRIAVERGTHSRSEVSLTSLQGGASVGTPWLPEGDMGRRSPLSEYVCLSTHLSHTTETSTLSRIKCERYIFIKKCVSSFIEVHKLCLIMFPLIFVLRLYNSGSTFYSPIYGSNRKSFKFDRNIWNHITEPKTDYCEIELLIFDWNTWNHWAAEYTDGFRAEM